MGRKIEGRVYDAVKMDGGNEWNKGRKDVEWKNDTQNEGVNGMNECMKEGRKHRYMIVEAMEGKIGGRQGWKNTK